MRPAVLGLLGLLMMMQMTALADMARFTDNLQLRSHMPFDNSDFAFKYLKSNQAINSESDLRILDLQNKKAGYQKAEEQYRGNLPLSWIAAVIGVCLIVGFLFGIWWSDYRSRQRHGGIRIY